MSRFWSFLVCLTATAGGPFLAKPYLQLGNNAAHEYDTEMTVTADMELRRPLNWLPTLTVDTFDENEIRRKEPPNRPSLLRRRVQCSHRRVR